MDGRYDPGACIGGHISLKEGRKEGRKEEDVSTVDSTNVRSMMGVSWRH